MSVLIVTSLGDIVVDVFTDRCPLTCKNFLKLCKTKYYNGCLFHTVQKDFTAQTGDPTGTGSGGDSIYKFLYGDQARFFGDEIHLDLKHSEIGTVAMASAGENLNASQFYITLREDLDSLDGNHTVFGKVAEGLETLERINGAYVDQDNRPFKNIRIKHTYVLDDPFDDPPQLSGLVPDASPEGKPKDEVVDDVRLEDDWVPLDEKLDSHELEEVLREKEAYSREVVLEAIQDIPEAGVKPPENVLFVCKLNPVTEDEDLHTIFSRFGTVSSAEIIRDYKTGDSLCYAFIEFEEEKACEEAYFKMDNALIDDRRIHVDFSQSVMKLWSEYRVKSVKLKSPKIARGEDKKTDHGVRVMVAETRIVVMVIRILEGNQEKIGGMEMIVATGTRERRQDIERGRNLILVAMQIEENMKRAMQMISVETEETTRQKRRGHGEGQRDSRGGREEKARRRMQLKRKAEIEEQMKRDIEVVIGAIGTEQMIESAEGRVKMTTTDIIARKALMTVIIPGGIDRRR